MLSLQKWPPFSYLEKAAKEMVSEGLLVGDFMMDLFEFE